MKRLLSACLLVLALPALALADDNNKKIDPEAYLCAELVSEPVIMKGEPPLFQGLQLDGYAAAGVNMPEASPDTVMVMLQQTYVWCQDRPEQKIMDFWRTLRRSGPRPESQWNAETSTCADYAANPEDASGFIIWLDAYNRAIRNMDKSILNTDEDVNAFIAACKAQPKRRMLDVLREHVK